MRADEIQYCWICQLTAIVKISFRPSDRIQNCLAVALNSSQRSHRHRSYSLSSCSKYSPLAEILGAAIKASRLLPLPL
jgi:hypothetical protein